jgi:uncharacterized membrane protein YfcA
MSEASPQLILIMTLTFFLAGMVKGVTGMGLPTVAMGVLGAIIPPVAAASMLIIPSFVTNVWQLYAGPRFADLVLRLWPMMLGIVVGTIAGSWLLTSVNTGWTTTGLGVALALYAGFSLLARPLSVPARFGYVVRTVDPSAHCRGYFSALVPDLPCPSWSRTHRSAISLMQAALGGGFEA